MILIKIQQSKNSNVKCRFIALQVEAVMCKAATHVSNLVKCSWDTEFFVSVVLALLCIFWFSRN